MHVFPIAKKIRPGIQIWRLVERLVNILKVEGKQKCPEFCDEDGFQLYAAVLESVIHPILIRMQRYKHHKGNVSKDLEVEYFIRISRSPSRGALNKAMYQGLGDSVINHIHRWE